MTHAQDTTHPPSEQLALLDEPDFIRQMLQRFFQQFLETEITQFLQADPYERTDQRQGYRNGYKPRQLTTRVGRLELQVPQDREGRFHSELFARYQRSEKALVLALQEAYLQGVSTRKVKKLTEQLCGTTVSKSFVSQVCQELDADIEAWRTRPLDQAYPYLMVDARYEHIRHNRRVVSQAVLVVQGVNQDGYRDLLAVAVAPAESQITWGTLFSQLAQRGLHGVDLVTSDAHQGLRQAVERYCPGAAWQYCHTHFQRTLLAWVPRAQRTEVADAIRQGLTAAEQGPARAHLQGLIDTYETTYPEVADQLEANLDFLLAHMIYPKAHRKRLRTTNALERLHREFARRSQVVQIFPNQAACLRLIAALAMEWSEEWTTGRRYLNMEAKNP